MTRTRVAFPLLVCLLAGLPALAQAPAAGELQVNVYTTGPQNSPSISQDAQGNYVVSWVSTQNGIDWDVYARRFDGGGSALGSEFRVNTYTTFSQFAPIVAHFPNGQFVVVWDSTYDGSQGGIAGQRFDAGGTPLGSEFIVNSYTTGIQVFAAVATHPGGFVVTWTSVPRDGSSAGVAAQRFDLAGNRLGSEFIVNTYTTAQEAFSSVAAHQDGSFVIAWTSQVQDPDGTNAVLGQRYASDGTRAGGEFQVNTYTTESQTFPFAASTPDGGFVVAWNSWEEEGAGGGYGVAVRRFSASGAPVGAEFVAETQTALNQTTPSVAVDASGNFVVVWRTASDGSGSGVHGRRFTASGAPRGGEFLVNTYTTGQQWTNLTGSTVAMDALGNFVVVWRSFGQDGSDYGIFTQRFGGLHPAALRVDPSAGGGANGNGVFEPGETVSVRPSWRNGNGATQAFGGTLLSFTGPAGATYSIADGSGDYGTVANGATTECVGCYALSLSDPSPRPVLHWDASVLESIVPESHGQQKPWTLHVGNSFSDVPATNPFYRFVETLLHRGITGGCSASTYCPSASTTREQMAVFVLVAKDGPGHVPPACTTPLFTDVLASNPFCPYIEELARRGVVSGCGGGKYCPNDPVTREQMAIFVLRTLDSTLSPPACAAPNTFDDVPETSPFCRWVEELARRNVVNGCGGSNYCPGQPVSREQMGVFIGATFGLTLYGL